MFWWLHFWLPGLLCFSWLSHALVLGFCWFTMLNVMDYYLGLLFFVPLMKLILSLCLVFLLVSFAVLPWLSWTALACDCLEVSLFSHQFWMINLLDMVILVSCLQYFEYVISCFSGFKHHWQEIWCYSDIFAFVGELSFPLI